MKLLKSLTAAATILGFASTANATLYIYDYPHSEPIEWMTSGETVSGTFVNLLTGLGIDWNTTAVVKAVIEFGFADTENGKITDYKRWYNGSYYYDSEEYISATAGGTALQIEQKTTSGSSSSNVQDDNLIIEDATGSSVEVNGTHGGTGYDYREANLDDAELDDIKNGSLDFTVKTEQGDVYLKTARLKIETAPIPPTTSVPDAGSTVALLASAFAGLIALRRKFRK